MSNTVHVAVAVIVDDTNNVCISLRHHEAHQGGLWEFPGGKVEENESVDAALIREIKEELGLDIKTFRPLITITHDYPDIKVCLHVRKILSFEGRAVGAEGQQVEWVPVDQLSSYDFPDANKPIIKALQLPERYLITGDFIDEDDFEKKLSAALRNNIKLVQLRLKDKHFDNIQHLILKTSSLCKKANAKFLLNVSAQLLNSIDTSTLGCDGVHADSRTLMTLTRRPKSILFSASCHSVAELLQAEKLKADFVVLSPVQLTNSHPDARPIGWQQFAEMAESVSIPVYALGGVSADDVEKAWSHGGQGVAAISAFWGN